MSARPRLSAFIAGVVIFFISVFALTPATFAQSSAGTGVIGVVTHGEQSFEEMMMGYMDYIDDAPADWKP